MNQNGTRFSSGHPAASGLDLNQAIRTLLHLWEAEPQNRNIAVILDLDSTLPRTSADAQKIEPVLLTLFARSRDAIAKAQKGHGTIIARTGLKAEKIQFSIADDGILDPSSDMETFFTLEQDRSLTVCATIVQDEGGELYAWYSHQSAVMRVIMDLPAKPGGGDTVRLLPPATRQKLQSTTTV